MSSHHIVQDQQEPALLIHRLAYFSVTVLHALLEWSPMVLCCEPTIDLYSNLGHKLDVALVGFDQMNSWEEELRNQMPVRILGSAENAFLDSGLELLKKEGHRTVNIITDDFSLLEVIRFSQHHIVDLELVIFTESGRHVLQKKLSYHKWLPSFSKLAIMPLRDRCYFTTEGFDNNLEEEWLHEGMELTKSREGDISIYCNQSPYLISEELQ